VIGGVAIAVEEQTATTPADRHPGRCTHPSYLQERSVRALVVDDSRTMRLILSRIMGELGFEVVEAPDGRRALEQLRAGEPMDVALVDWNMPEMNGYELLRALRASRAYARMPVIMVTTETERSQILLALENGANEYIMKPFTKTAVLEKLALLQLLPD
jgi:two-component system chemotaxis response regulator CheY